jgi:hypothetical protein
MPLARYDQTGPFRYDYAIAGVPFLSAESEQYPYLRQTAQNRRDQINTTRDVGEQSLDGWWYRSQSSFHMGAGLRFFDSISSDTSHLRFEDSHGVNVWTPGEVSLLRSTTWRWWVSSGFALSFSSDGIGSGVDGYLYANRMADNVLWRSTTGATASFAVSATEQVLDIAEDGINVYVLTSGGIYKVTNITEATRTITKIYSRSITRGKMAYLKDRLMVVADRLVYALGTSPASVKTLGIVDDPDSTKEDAKYELPAGFRGVEFADGPNAIYLCARSEENSYVYAFTISADADVSINAPYTVLEAPRGERFLSMITYIGTYLIVGSNLGVRVGVIAGDSSVVMGALSIKSDGPVRALFAMNDFVWAGGANSGGYYGLYRLNLATPLDEQALTFPWAKDIYSAVAWTGSIEDYVQSITRNGKTDQIVFSVRRAESNNANAGVYEENTTRVANGWLKTGRVRMDTTQPKVFHKATVTMGGSAGGVQTYLWNETGTSDSSINSSPLNAFGSQTVSFSASDGEPRAWAQYRFLIWQNSNSATPPFRFHGYQLQVNPSRVKGRIYQVPLLCMSNERGMNGRNVTRDVLSRVRSIEALEESGKVVLFQDFISGEEREVLIEEVQYISQHIPENYKQRSNDGGVLVLNLRAVDTTT